MLKKVDTKKQKPVLYTIGHSTRPIGEFVDLLKVHGIRQLVDVRTIPKSRYNPQFNEDSFSSSLSEADIEYVHESALGGLRHPKKDSVNTGWRNASFRGYADYMQTAEFSHAIEDLKKKALRKVTAIMCAEAVPWRCHRSMVADALVAQKWDVLHIMTKTVANKHKLTSFAKIKSGRIFYPAE
jgi:uncharacterized protein (DUF488 family)